MHVEQNLKIKLKGPRPLVLHAILKQIIFIAKQKFPRQIFKWIIIYC